MKLNAFLFILGITLVARAQDEIPQERRELNELFESVQRWDQRLEALRRLPAEKKEAYIEFTRKDLSTETSPGGRDQILEILYYLGDTAARDELVRNYYRDGTDSRTAMQSSTFSAAGDPELVPMLAPALLCPEPYRRFGDDAFTYPLSFQTAPTVIGIIRNSPAFSADVINWARRFPKSDTPPTEELREIVREWWRAHEPFFREKNYKAVQPGRDLKPDPVPDLTPEVPASPPATPAPPILASKSSAATPATSPAEIPSNALLWTGAVAAFVLLAGLLFFWRR